MYVSQNLYKLTEYELAYCKSQFVIHFEQHVIQMSQILVLFPVSETQIRNVLLKCDATGNP